MKASFAISGDACSPRLSAAGAPGSLAPVLNTSFPAEDADSYEVGVKSTLLDRTLLLNATLFLP